MKEIVKLKLNQSGYPKNFRKHNIQIADDEKQEFFEHRLIETLNQINNKLKIETVEYCNLNNEFENNFLTSYSGLIVKEQIIEEIQKTKLKNQGYQIKSKNNQLIATRVLAYVFLSANKEEFRDTLFTQSIFPDILDSMKVYLDSPSYTILNHPIYFIDVIDKKITALTLIRRLALMIASGVHYVELFNNQTISPRDVPTQIVRFMNKYELKKNRTLSGYETDYLSLNFDKNELKIKDITSRLVTTQRGNLDFHGSDEKFYWMDILFISIIAANSGFSINFKEYEKFVINNKSQFTNNSKKMARCVILLQYLEKLSLKK